MKIRNKFKVGIVQLDVGPDREANLSRARKLCLTAARRGAKVVCLPELFSYMGSFGHPCDAREAKDGPSLAMLREIARDKSIYIVAGSILERKGSGLPINTCYLIDPKGRLVSRYSKLHLFDIEVPGKICFRETGTMRPGNHVSIAKTPLGTFGFAICNDIRYPELFRKMVLAGAEVIFIPSAFTKYTGRSHWISLASVRAIENQCYIVAVNQSGKNADGVRFFGSSLAVDPWGKILTEAPSKGDAVRLCDIDLGKLATFRKQLPALKKIRKNYPLRKFR